MKKLNLAIATILELTDEFLRLAIAKGDAVMEFETRKVNRLYWQMEAVEKELNIVQVISGVGDVGRVAGKVASGSPDDYRPQRISICWRCGNDFASSGNRFL